MGLKTLRPAEVLEVLEKRKSAKLQEYLRVYKRIISSNWGVNKVEREDVVRHSLFLF